MLSCPTDSGIRVMVDLPQTQTTRCRPPFFNPLVVERQVEAFASEFVAANPRLNILINNAGGIPSERTLSAQGNEAVMVQWMCPLNAQ